MRYPKRAYTFSVDYFSTPESVDPEIWILKGYQERMSIKKSIRLIQYKQKRPLGYTLLALLGCMN
ncbi:hypothetical protein [Lactiplantibacillus plantarum]|uniref:hypothetical protein n=1 Tax=Lactiplantibacillus plantarum TaxID=1590 RepID=UPI003D692AAF